jgi:hypothetical protein
MRTPQVKMSVMLDQELNQLLMEERKRIIQQTGVEPPLTRIASRVMKLGFEALKEINNHGI